jgi:cysteine desulfurase
LPIYLDNHATTRTDPRVLDAMLPYFTEHYGNAASRTHSFGWKAEEAVELARSQVAALIGAEAKEIIFTSGATESDNLAIKGAARMQRRQGNHIVTVQTEHHAVLDPCRRLQSEGFDVTFLPVDRFGRVTQDQVADALTPRTILVSVMLANNEVGTLQPVAEIGKLCKERGVLLHTDATQAAGKVPIDVETLHADLISLSAHKMYGPKGVGALYVRRRSPHVRLEPLFDGGGHERGMRSGTLNVPGIVGFGEACAIAAVEMAGECVRVRALRDRLLARLRAALDGVHVHGSMEHRLSGNLNVSFEGIDGDALLVALPDLAVSTGSACSSHGASGSHVLESIGVPPALLQSATRFGLGRFTSEEEVEYAAGRVIEVVRKLRAESPAGG